MTRMTLAEAREKGLLDGIGGRTPRKKYASTEGAQSLIFCALKKVIHEDDLVYEAKAIIPGRRYRADIFIRSTRIAIEMDGFQFHRSLSAFKKDRIRQNEFAAHGVVVLRFFYDQVIRDMDYVINTILKTHQYQLRASP